MARSRLPAVDPHFSPDVRVRHRTGAGTPWPVLAVVAAGGACGALARYGLSVGWTHQPAGFPWATFAGNATGCLLIGGLTVLVDHVRAGRRLVRPFLGVGVLGGFTTFSGYVLDIRRMLDAGAAGLALVYLAGTVVVALLAVWAGQKAVLGTLTLGRRVRRTRRETR